MGRKIRYLGPSERAAIERLQDFWEHISMDKEQIQPPPLLR